ncbi:MAG: hypothetical protein R3Y64_04950 [Peptostreptococcaceae bacterium]
MSIDFGKLLEILISFSGQKNYSLAKYLDYDVSYISKWINLSTLPTAKNITTISDKISKFVVDNLDEESFSRIIEYFRVKCSKDELRELIKDKLNDSYNYSKNKKEKLDYKENDYNTLLKINPRFSENIKNEEIYIEEGKNNDIIIACDLFALSDEHKKYLSRIRKGSIDKDDLENSKIRFLINFNKESSTDLIFDSILLIHMMNYYSDLDFNCYSCEYPSSVLSFSMKNNIFQNIIYKNDKKPLFINKSNDKDIIKDSYNSLESMINTESRATFTKKKSYDIILDKLYIQYIIGQDLKWLIGNISELFMPSDLFLEIGEMVFGEESIEELKRIDAILQNATYFSNIEVLIYESAIRKYITNGELIFFNNEVILNFDQRKRHIEYMEKLFKENKDINVGLINGNLVEDFKNLENPSLYTSKNLSFINTKEDNNYLLVRDDKLHDFFNDFFKNVCLNKKESVTSNKEEVISIISDALNYARILEETNSY